MTATRAVVVRTADGLALDAEVAPARAAGPTRATVVLCHPHPQYGGTMHSIVIGALFDALPALGCTCLRFDFRGVGRSEGTTTAGRDEPLDVAAALAVACDEAGGTGSGRPPAVLAGWSFGADMALAVVDPRVAGWVAIAPPLRFRPGFDAVARDARPKHLVLAAHDEYREPEEVRAEVRDWVDTTIAVVPGASHFFVGRTDRVVEEARAGIERALR